MEGAFGVKLKITVSNTLTAIAHLEEVDYPEFEKTLAKIRCHDSAGGYPDYIDTGARDINSIKATLVWDVSESTHAAIVTAFDSTTPVGMSIEDPEGDEVITFDAHIQKVGRIAKSEDAFKCEVEIQPTGEPGINESV